jgi:4-hydroxy-tetrahydrodipicolinate synthase
MTQTSLRRACGVFAPVLTPFHDDLEPDADAFVTHCRWLLENDVGLAIFGTNSEANSLSVSERMALTDHLLEARVDPSRIMTGTGCCSFKDTIALTRHAVNAGITDVLMLPPFYYKNISEDGAFGFYSEVIEAVASRSLAVYLYHIPALSGVPITLSLIERLHTRYPGTIAGIKDSSGDWQNTQTLLAHLGGNGFSVFPGSEVFLLSALRAGGAGCISATANVNPAMLSALYRLADTPKAEDLNRQAIAIRTAFQQLPMVPAMKAVTARRHRHDGWLNIRPPLTRLESSGMAKAAGLLDEIGKAASAMAQA